MARRESRTLPILRAADVDATDYFLVARRVSPSATEAEFAAAPPPFEFPMSEAEQRFGGTGGGTPGSGSGTQIAGSKRLFAQWHIASMSRGAITWANPRASLVASPPGVSLRTSGATEQIGFTTDAIPANCIAIYWEAIVNNLVTARGAFPPMPAGLDDYNAVGVVSYQQCAINRDARFVLYFGSDAADTGFGAGAFYRLYPRTFSDGGDFSASGGARIELSFITGGGGGDLVNAATPEIAEFADDDYVPGWDASLATPAWRRVPGSKIWSWIARRLRASFYATEVAGTVWTLPGADRRGSFLITTDTSGAPDPANAILPNAMVSGTTYTMAMAASVYDRDGDFETVISARLGALMYMVPFDPLDPDVSIALGTIGTRTAAGTGNGAYIYFTFVPTITGTVAAGDKFWRFSERNPIALDFTLSIDHVFQLGGKLRRLFGVGGTADQVWTRGTSPTNAGWKTAHTDIIAESTDAQAEQGTDSAAANRTRMTPRRVWEAMRALLGGHTNQLFFSFQGFDWTGTNARTEGAFWIATTASGAPNVADRVASWNAITAGSRVLLLGVRSIAQDAESFPAYTPPTTFPLVIAAIEGGTGGYITFTPDDGTSWATIQTGDKLLNWRRGTIAVVGALTGGAGTFTRFSNVTPAMAPFRLVIGWRDIVNPPWLKPPTNARSGHATWLNTEADGDPTYGDPLAPLAGHDGDRYFARSAVSPTDNLFAIPDGGGQDGLCGFHSHPTAALSDANVYSNWTDIGAGRRQIWVSKRSYPPPGGVPDVIASMLAGSFVAVVNIDQGGGHLVLSNPGTITSVDSASGSGGAGYWRWPVDVAISGTLTGEGANLRFHSVETTRRAVEIPYTALRGVPNPHGIARRPRQVSGALTLTLQDLAGGVLIVATGTAAFTVTLPGNPPAGSSFVIANISTGTVTLDGNGADTVDGAATATVNPTETREVFAVSASAWVLLG